MIQLLFRVASARLGRLRCFAVFDAAFIAQITAFLGLCFAFGRLAMLVHLFLDEAGTFFNLTLDAHVRFPLLAFPTEIRDERERAMKAV
jgi:hypothetical protein